MSLPGELIAAAIVVLVSIIVSVASCTSKVNMCERHFKEVPTWECVISDSYKVRKVQR